MYCDGEARELKIGSVRSMSSSISTISVACPSQVTLKPASRTPASSGSLIKYGLSTGSSLSSSYVYKERKEKQQLKRKGIISSQNIFYISYSKKNYLGRTEVIQ
jgi:hypothetical protein